MLAKPFSNSNQTIYRPQTNSAKIMTRKDETLEQTVYRPQQIDVKADNQLLPYNQNLGLKSDNYGVLIRKSQTNVANPFNPLNSNNPPANKPSSRRKKNGTLYSAPSEREHVITEQRTVDNSNFTLNIQQSGLSVMVDYKREMRNQDKHALTSRLENNQLKNLNNASLLETSISSSTFSLFLLPESWSKDSYYGNKVVSLDKSDGDYKEVKNLFYQSINCLSISIVKVNLPYNCLIIIILDLNLINSGS